MKAEIRNEPRHLTPTLSPIEAERASDAPCVTRFELAALLRVSVRTVDRMIAAGELPVRRVRGRAVRFMRSDVEQYLSGGAECGVRSAKCGAGSRKGDHRTTDYETKADGRRKTEDRRNAETLKR